MSKNRQGAAKADRVERRRQPNVRYRITNWPAYNQSLIARGAVTLWLHDEVIARSHDVTGTGKVFHDRVIQCALSLRVLVRLALRQTEGFLRSLLHLLDLALRVPHYSTLCRRAGSLQIATSPLARRQGPVHLVVDISGLKVFGEGECQVRSHGASKRRTWRKLHLGVDAADGTILARDLTGNDRHDGQRLAPLLDQAETRLAALDAKLAKVTGDGAYDSFACHRTILDQGAEPYPDPPQSIHAQLHSGNKAEPSGSADADRL